MFLMSLPYRHIIPIQSVFINRFTLTNHKHTDLGDYFIFQTLILLLNVNHFVVKLHLTAIAGL